MEMCAAAVDQIYRSEKQESAAQRNYFVIQTKNLKKPSVDFRGSCSDRQKLFEVDTAQGKVSKLRTANKLVSVRAAAIKKWD
jgi:hypothetical protein